MKVKRFLKRLLLLKIQKVYEVDKNRISIISKQDYSIESINESNLNNLELLRNKNTIDNFREFLLNGEKGFCIYKDNNCVAHGWLIINQHNKGKKVCGYFKLPPMSAFIHYCYVSETERGKGLYKYLLCHIYNYCFDVIINISHILIDTNINNIPAQKAIVASGGVHIYNMYIVRFLGKNIISIKIKVK